MREELNHTTLQRAIKDLPAYEPPAELWQRIENDLREDPLHEALGKLPAYDPPDSLWDSIQQRLEHRPAASAKRIRLNTKTWVSMAAGIALLLSGVLWLDLQPPVDAPVVTMSYGEESVPVLAAAIAPNEEEGEFTSILEIFDQQPYLRSMVDYVRLRGELEELHEAKLSLQEALERYGNDAALVRQLGRIERDRSDILKELAAAI